MVSDAFGRQDSPVLHIMHDQEIPIFLPFFHAKYFMRMGRTHKITGLTQYEIRPHT